MHPRVVDRAVQVAVFHSEAACLRSAAFSVSLYQATYCTDALDYEPG